MKKIKFEHPALDKPIEVFGKYVVCPICEGEGSHERRDIDTSRMVDIMREDGDEEGLERYFAGAYNITCTECKGIRVVLEPVLPEDIQIQMRDYYDWKREDNEYAEQERRMGA